MTILGEKPNNSIYSPASLALRVIFVCHKRPQIYASGMTISGERTEQHIVIGFGELAAYWQLEYVDIRLVY